MRIPGRIAPVGAQSPGDVRHPPWRCEGSAPFTGARRSDLEPKDISVETADGLRLHVAEFRGGAAPELLLVHGSFGHARQWDPLLPHLPPNRRVLALDLPGHGDSDHAAREDRYAFPRLVEDIAGVSSALGLRPVVAGHSVGSALAMQLAALHRNSLVAAVLMDIDPRLPDGQAAHLNQAGLAPPRTYDDFERAVAREARAAPQAAPAIHKHLARHAFRESEGRWEQKFDQAFLRSIRVWDNLEILPAIHVPVLALRGQESIVISEDGFRALLEGIPDVRGETVPGATHQLHLDRPEAVGLAITRFVESRAPCPG